MMNNDERYWQFYCYRCYQWCERRGPWCELFESEPRTSPCIFREHPERANGVRWWPYHDEQVDEDHWDQVIRDYEAGKRRYPPDLK